jgi:Tfp pilus assembly pilus retraction ATPase PilT
MGRTLGSYPIQGIRSAPSVADFIAGRNCCVLVYGESGSGKSYTILGPSAATINQAGKWGYGGR